MPSYSMFRGDLASFGAEDDNKYVRKAGFALQGNDGAWNTIPSDEYRVRRRTGRVEQVLADDDGNPTNWDAYDPDLGGGGWRVTYTVFDNGTETVYTNESITLVETPPYEGDFDTEIADNPVIEFIDAEQGRIANWLVGVIDANTLSADNGNVKINSAIPALSLGAASAFGTGIGIWQGKDAGTYKWRVGDPSGNKAQWDGSIFSVTGTITATSGTIGGWTIGASSLTGGNATLHSSGYLLLGTSNDIVRLDATDATYRLWIGNAVAASAPFRATKLGAVTATNIDLAGGSVSGTFTVSGTLRSSASNPRYTLDSTGFKGYDSGGTQRYQILNDGSGWLGSSSVFSWTTSGVVSLNGSAVVGNSLDADKTTFTAPTISGLTLTNNSPGAGSVAWSSFKLTYQGASYTVSSGNTSNKYIYWKKSASTTVLQTSASIPAQGADTFIVALNLSGTAQQSNFAPFIYADYISVGQLSAISADLGSITAGTVTGATIRTSSSGARTEMNASNLFGLGFGGIGGTDGTTAQWYAKASDGKFYASGGKFIIDVLGPRLLWTTSGLPERGFRFRDDADSNTVAKIDGYVDSSAVRLDIATVNYGTRNSTLGITSSTGGSVGASAIGFLNAYHPSSGNEAQVKVNATNTASEIELRGNVKMYADNTYDFGASGGNRARDIYITGENRFFSERAIAQGIYDRANSDTTVQNTTTETTLYSKSITANDLGSTGGLRVIVRGTWLNNTGANRTMTVRFKLGATTLNTQSHTLTTSGTTGSFLLEAILFNTATNAQRLALITEFFRSGAVTDGTRSTTGTSAEDTTSAKTFTISVQWDSASLSATITKKIACMEIMPA